MKHWINPTQMPVFMFFLIASTATVTAEQPKAGVSTPFSIQVREVTQKEIKSWRLTSECDKKRAEMNAARVEACYKLACDKGETKGCAVFALLLEETKSGR